MTTKATIAGMTRFTKTTLHKSLQVFLKECKYQERDVIFNSLLSDDEDEGYDTVH